VLTALLAVALWTVALPGIGSLPGPRSLFPDARPGERVVLRTVWGLAVLAAGATLFNFFAPLGPAFAFAALASGLAGAWAHRRELTEGADRADAMAAGGIVALLSAVAAFPAAHYDTGLYHLSLVRWMTAGPLPAGLANLHERFGVASIWFPLSPALALPFAPGSEAYLASTQIAAVLALAAWSGARKALRGTAGVPDLFLAAGFIPLVWAFLERSLPSPSPDLAVAILTILSLASVGRAFGSGARGGESADFHRAILLALFAAAAKLSAAPLAAAVVAVSGTALALKRSRFPIRFALGAALLLLPSAARSVVLTGHVVYPVAWTRIHGLPWAVPETIVREDVTRIRSWARVPALPFRASIPAAEWIGPWLGRNFRLFGWPVAAPAFYGVFLLAALPVLFRRSMPPGERPELLVPWAVSAVGLACWFLMAPDPRFAEGILFGVALLPSSAALLRLVPAPLPTRRVVPVAVAAALLVLGAVGAIEGLRTAKGISHRPGWIAPPAPTVPPVETRRTRSGLEIQVPLNGDRCWDAPLPCTPFFREDLAAQRDSRGRFRSFTLQPDSY
jgi:hypothetical protein